MSANEFELVKGSGNVFRDLDEPDADINQAKALLAAQIIGSLNEQGLSVRKTHQVTGFAAADLSRVRNGELSRFTLERLIRILSLLDDRIEVSIQIT